MYRTAPACPTVGARPKPAWGPAGSVPGVAADRPRPRVPPNCDLTLGLTCVDKSEPGVTVWRMPADERFANPVGVLQGGFVTALADSAMAASTVTWASGRDLRI